MGGVGPGTAVPVGGAPARGQRGLAAAVRGAAAAGIGAWLLAGCAAVQKVIDPEAAAPPSPVRLEVAAPAPLKKILERHLDLARLPRLAAARGAEITATEIDRLVAAVPEQARELLATEGYFDPDVTAERVPGEPPTVRVAVDPRERSTVRQVAIDGAGELIEAQRSGDTRATGVWQALRDEWPMPPGTPFRNDTWSGAKRSSIAQLRAQGYVGAQWRSTEARADASAAAVDLSLVADSGPLYLTGGLRIRGLNFHDEQTVRNLADFPVGSVATEARLLDYQERLQKSGLFERATVQLDPRGEDPKDTTLVVRLTEAKLQEATVGLGYKTDEGIHGSLKHEHRRVFGWAATARNQIELSQVRQAWDGEIKSHTLPGLWRNLVGGAAERLVSDDDVVLAARLRVGREQSTVNIDRLYFVQAERSQRKTDATRETTDALGVHFHGIWRQLDDNLLPTRGQAYAAQVAAGLAQSDFADSGAFGRLYLHARAFRPIGSWFAQGRLELGQVFVGDRVAVPDSLLFRAGGDNSVRGYEYRSLAPVVDGRVAGGRVLMTASAEIARPFIERLPQLWGAVFVDAGRAADRWSDLKPAIGVGVGVRYRSPIGPLAVDLAYGEELRKFRLHITLGTTF